ncbi:MAG: sensor histidine kinase [Kangiella sp.]|nr:sensor histidine kinase [Kangiella sp.]
MSKQELITQKETSSQNKNEKEETISFEVASAVLKEIGEQLVSSPQVALTELIKNAYDADAEVAELSYDKNSITLVDDGHGMTEEDFKRKWMKVGTGNKIRNRKSKLYGRDITGSKGVGRFAVRFLGHVLELETVAKEGAIKKKITAIFDWKRIDKTEDLRKVTIKYKVISNVADKTGTTIRIKKLRKFGYIEEISKDIKSNLLNIVSPLQPIIEDLNIKFKKKNDPGFDFVIKDENNSGEDESNSVAREVINRYLAKAVVHYQSKENILSVIIKHKNIKAVNDFKIKFESTIDNDVFADIRYFPRRGGMFTGIKGIDGNKAYGWVKDNCGIGIYDRGFKVSPYGDESDDWLYQTIDTARSRRDWRSELMMEHFPMPEDVFRSPKLNYMLNLPRRIQSVGAVFIESNPERNKNGLTPNMDRQGFKNNEAYADLVEMVRFAIEYLAMVDKKHINFVDKKKIEEKKKELRSDIKETIKEIKSIQSLNPKDKAELVKKYEYLHSNIDEVEEYNKKARSDLEVMGLLGVIAGFMTHEYHAAIDNLERASELLKTLGKKDSRFLEYRNKIEKNIDYFSNYIAYTKGFVTSLKKDTNQKYKSYPRVKFVTETFSGICNEYNISVDIDIKKDMYAPELPIALYQGIMHNLLTNAIKALIYEHGKERKIKIMAWNESKKNKVIHIIQVMDNGPGIPYAMQKRIWNPLFTTTSENNPLGSGMGLGLSLLKTVVNNYGGYIDLVEPPADFHTCFKVELSM